MYAENQSSSIHQRTKSKQRTFNGRNAQAVFAGLLERFSDRGVLEHGVVSSARDFDVADDVEAISTHLADSSTNETLKS